MSSVVISLVTAAALYLAHSLLKEHCERNLSRHQDCFMCRNLEKCLISNKNLVKYVCLPYVLLTAVFQHPELLLWIEMAIFASQLETVKRIVSSYQF